MFKQDGKDRNRFRTLLTQYSPAELLYTESEATLCALSEDTLHLVKSLVSSVQLEVLHPKGEFWGTDQTVGGSFTHSNNVLFIYICPDTVKKIPIFPSGQGTAERLLLL